MKLSGAGTSHLESNQEREAEEDGKKVTSVPVPPVGPPGPVPETEIYDIEGIYVECIKSKYFPTPHNL